MEFDDEVAVKFAIIVCTRPDIKIKLLSKSRSRWDRKKGKHEHSWADQCQQIERKARKILRNLNCSESLQEKCLGLVFLIAARMLTWVVYHEEILGLSRKRCINLLNHDDFFTSEGIIDNKKAAEVLIQDESLNTLQKYTLSCLYCLVDHIPVLYCQVADKESVCIYNEIVEFWTYYVKNEVDKHKGTKSIGEYRFEKAVESGSLAAVKYCIEETRDVGENAIMWAALKALRQVSKTDYRFDLRDINCMQAWVPRDHYMGMLFFLFTQMREDQQIVLLKKDIETSNRRRLPINRYSRILEYFLDWPYQGYFMKTADLIWEFLPEISYAILLIRICDRIECSDEPLKFGQEKWYDYRGLLKAFWERSPESFKRYVLSNPEISYETALTIIKTKAVTQLIENLLSSKKFTNEDGEFVRIIYASSKTNGSMSLEEWIDFCIRFLKKRKWKILDRFLLNCFSSKMEENTFKMKLISTKEAQCIFINFVKRRQWKSAESLLERSSLGEEEIIEFKESMLYSDEGMEACRDLFLSGKVIEVDKIIYWSFSSDAKARTYISELVCSYDDISLTVIISCLLNDWDRTNELLTKYFNTGRKFKEAVVDKICLACKGLIWHYYYKDRLRDDGSQLTSTILFPDNIWENLVKFLTWCLPPQELMNELKKRMLLKKAAEKINFELIIVNQWTEAEKFFFSLGLSTEEVIKLKDKIRSHLAISTYGNRSSRYGYILVGDFVQWFLTNEAAVLEFDFREYLLKSGCHTIVLENYDLWKDQLLSDYGLTN